MTDKRSEWGLVGAGWIMKVWFAAVELWLSFKEVVLGLRRIPVGF